MARVALRLAFAFLVVSLSSLPAGAVPQFGSSEFQVNTYTSDYQSDPAVCATGDGTFVIAWTSAEQDGDLGGIFGQRYDASGVALGGQFQVNTYTSQNQESPEVCCAADGSFVVVWESFEKDGYDDGIFGQRFSAAGAPVGGEFQVNTYTFEEQKDPRVCCAGGSFVVVWESYQDGSYDEDIFGQRFSLASGAPLGLEFQVNTFTPDEQEDPGLCCAPDGAFVVTWEDEGDRDGDAEGVFGQRFAAAGSPLGGEFQVNTYTLSYQDNPAACCGADGSFVVAWQGAGNQDGDFAGIFAQRFASSGAAQGSEFQVNTYTPDGQYSPALCCGADGFVVAWHGEFQDGDGNGVFAQAFDGSGGAVGAEFQVHAYTVGFQGDPALACDPSDRILAAWVSGGEGGSDQDGDGAGVFARLLVEPLTILEIPTLAPVGLVALATLLGAGALIALRRR